MQAKVIGIAAAVIGAGLLSLGLATERREREHEEL